ATRTRPRGGRLRAAGSQGGGGNLRGGGFLNGPMTVAPAKPPPPAVVVPAVARPASPVRRWDPRLYQIATLGGLLGYGVLWLDLEVQPANAVAIIVTVLTTQLACAVLGRRDRLDPRSALISGLSLCLLLRTD